MMHIERPWHPGIKPIDLESTRPLVVFEKIEKVWVLSRVNHSVSVRESIQVFSSKPPKHIIVEFMGEFDFDAVYSNVSYCADVLMKEGSVSLGRVHYELEEKDVRSI